MTDNKDLRQKAEKLALEKTSLENIENMTQAEVRQMLHELRVHQIELEMQNEELRATQESLDASRARYFDLYDLAPIGYVTLNEQGIILEANLTAATLLGESRSNLVYRPISGFILKQDKDIYYQRRKQLFESGEPQECELRMVQKDGATFWAHLTATAAQYDSGPVCRIVMINITERKQAEETLQKTQKQLIKAHRLAQIGIWDWIADTDAVTWTEELYRITGLDPMMPAPTYADHLNLYTPESWARLKAAVEKALGTGLPYQLELELIRSDASIRWVNAFGGAVYDDQGQVKGLHGTVQDITERKQAEEVLRESKCRAEQYLNVAAEIIISIDRQGNIILLNSSGHKLLGYDPGELIGKNWFKTCLPEDSVSEVHEVFNKLMNAELENVEHFENMIKTKEGLLRCVFWHNTLLKDAEDNVIGLLSSGEDITERRRSVEALRQSEARLRLALKAAIAGVWEWDIHTNQNLWSEELYQLYDLDPKITEASYESWMQSVFPEDRKAIQIAVHEAAGSERELNIEWRVNTTDGSLRWLMSRGQPLRDAGGKVLKYNGIVIDITERKQSRAERDELQARLNQAQKMESIGTLAGGIAHDFNNILFPIVGHTEMLMDDLSEENSAIRNSLKEIYSGALRARDLVQQILAFARQEKSELTLMKMQPIIKEAMKLIRSTIPTTISITQHLNPDCGPVAADPTQIHQIVMNLATNAYHAMEKTGGELKVALKKIELGKDDPTHPDMSPGLYACLSVADTGAGMKKEVMNRIFDPFFTTKEKGKGTGMGLSVVHGIVKGMNGDIQVHSEPGKGTEFLVYLPVAGKAAEKQESKADEPMQGGCERLLLVDDEQAILAIEKRILERLGYQVTSRPGSLEALEAFKAGPDKFDLVITDMSMPNMPGDKLAGELIKIRPDIPILLCTGYSESMTAEKINSLGIKGFLMKPMMIKEFAQTVRDVLDGSRDQIP